MLVWWAHLFNCSYICNWWFLNIYTFKDLGKISFPVLQHIKIYQENILSDTKNWSDYTNDLNTKHLKTGYFEDRYSKSLVLNIWANYQASENNSTGNRYSSKTRWLENNSCEHLWQSMVIIRVFEYSSWHIHNRLLQFVLYQRFETCLEDESQVGTLICRSLLLCNIQ